MRAMDQLKHCLNYSALTSPTVLAAVVGNPSNPGLQLIALLTLLLIKFHIMEFMHE
jgi:hypothetical protein